MRSNLTFEDFKNLTLKYNKCPNDIGYRKRPLNEKQLKTRYEKYIKSNNKKDKNKDERWEEIVALVRQRDNNECQFLKNLNSEFKRDIDKKMFGVMYKLDPAHIFGKGTYPHLKYDPENIVLVSRYVHTCLDNYKNPFSGKPITAEERKMFWIQIIGKKRYEKLENKK